MKNKFLKLFIVLTILTSFLFSQIAYAQAADSTSTNNAEYLKSIMDMIKEKYKDTITDEQLIEGALKGMFGTMDAYTTFFNNTEADSFLGNINGTYEGIGVMIEKEDNYVIMSKIFADSPAQKAGLMARDKFAEVDGKSVVGASIEEVQKLVMGPAGTKVKLGIIRDSEKEMLQIEVNRGQIKVNPVSYEIRGDVGYIKLDIFNANSSQYMTEALEEMDKNKITKIVLDLRDNPGGLVDQAAAIARNFIPEGLITKLDFKSEDQQDQEYYSYLKTIKYKLAVLVNENSASASEILAGAIQDTKVGKLIGTTTFGKGKVQNFYPILTPAAYKKYQDQLNVSEVDGYALIAKYGVNPLLTEVVGWSKITTGQYTTPNGRMIDEIGIAPNYKIKNYSKPNDIDVNGIKKISENAKFELNSESTDIYNVEKILSLSGYDIDKPDMKLDEKTLIAIDEFQKDKNISTEAELSTQTITKMNEQLGYLIDTIDKQYAKAVYTLNFVK